jgi:hypothetical protein
VFSDNLKLAGIVSSKSGRVKHARNAPTWHPGNRENSHTTYLSTR